MKIAQLPTACDSYLSITESGIDLHQNDALIEFIRSRGGDWTIAEIAAALGWEKSTASRVINDLLHNNPPRLVAYPERNGRTYPYKMSRPVGLPPVGQLKLALN